MLTSAGKKEHLSLRTPLSGCLFKYQSVQTIFYDLCSFLIGIHSMQGRTATTRHGVTRKRPTKRFKHTLNLFRKNLQLIGVC